MANIDKFVEERRDKLVTLKNGKFLKTIYILVKNFLQIPTKKTDNEQSLIVTYYSLAKVHQGR